VGVALAHDLGEDVEPAGGDHDVVDLLDRRQGLGDRLAGTLDDHPQQRLPAEPELERVGDRDDLHHAGVLELLDAAAHGVLREADGVTDLGVGASAVLLEVLDDRPGREVQLHPGRQRGAVLRPLTLGVSFALDHVAPSGRRRCDDTGPNGSRR
jgi:hypothetical protein